VPERVILRPFKPIKLKRPPAGLARTFPSEIRTVQAAIKFVNSLDSKTRAKLHGNWLHRLWLHLILGPFGKALTTVRIRRCATLWRPNAGWPTENEQPIERQRTAMSRCGRPAGGSIQNP